MKKNFKVIHASADNRSVVLRIAWWLFIACAVMAAFGLVLEAWQFTQSMPDRGRNFQVARIAGLILLNLIFTATLASLAVLYVWGRLATALPDLKGWHIHRVNCFYLTLTG
jgi:ribose/xylose/arabinose/galactoside ABC-type transport system permease subunit